MEMTVASAGLVVGYAASTLTGSPHLRYGFTLDTRRVQRDLGFRPTHRVGLGRAGDGRLQLETSPV